MADTICRHEKSTLEDGTVAVNVIWVKSDYLFPLDMGGKIRTFNLLQHINREVPITYVGFSPNPSGQDNPHFQQCTSKVLTVQRANEEHTGASFYLRVAANILSQYPYFIRRNISREVRRMIGRLAADRKCDLIVCDSLNMAANIDFSVNVPKLLFQQSVETTLWQQRYQTATTTTQKTYFNYEAKRMAAYETEMCNRFDLVVAVSESDRSVLVDELKVRTPVEVIPTGVDCEYFKPDASAAVIPRRLMFSGSMELLSNIDQLLWFASEILPLIRQRCPDVTLDIVGRNPASEIVALGEADKSIRVTGMVPDIRPYLSQADIYIVPLRVPGGTRVKIYEALAMRKPVVSTPYGIEGLTLSHGLHVMLADSPREFADAVCDLFDDPEKKAALADRGWRLVNETCDWSVSAGKFVELFRRLKSGSSK